MSAFPTTREVAIDEVDMEFLADPVTGKPFTAPTLRLRQAQQAQRWIDVLIAAGEPELAEELRRELRMMGLKP